MTRLCSAAISIAITLTALLAVLFLNAPPARGHHTEEHTWLLSWIPSYCCVTNDCCREVHESDVTSLPNDFWRINASGQVLKRTAFSPNGRYYRCYCDYDSTQGKWIVHPTAHTRCIFPPFHGS